MDFGEVIVLGLVQGLTEFLPVSSSGHLVAARLLFNISDIEGNAFDAFLHLGTLLAVLVFYWRVWWGIGRGIVVNDIEGKDKRELAAKLALATVPAAIAGYLWQANVESFFRSAVSVSVGLLVTAAALASVEILVRREMTIKRASFFDAVLIGLAQVVALMPGASRSGITIAAGRARGLSRGQATKFSFLLSAPIIAGAGLAHIGQLAVGGSFTFGQLVLGFVISFGAGLLAIFSLLKIAEKMSFWIFVVYLIGLAVVLLAW